MTCKADAIVIGKIHTALSHLNSNKNAIYRDIDFDPDLVLHDNARSSLLNKHHILMTGVGGAWKVGPGLVTYIDNSHPPLQANVTYLLFLQYIPETNGYFVFDSFGTLQLTGTSQWVFSRAAYRHSVMSQLQDAALRTAISRAACQ